MKKLKKYLFLALLILVPVFVSAENSSCYGQLNTNISFNKGDTFTYEIGLDSINGADDGTFGISYVIEYSENDLELIEVGAYNEWEYVDYYIENDEYLYDKLHIEIKTSNLNKYLTFDNTNQLSFVKIGYIKFKVKDTISTMARIFINGESLYYSQWTSTDGTIHEDSNECDPSTLGYTIININEKNNDTTLKNLSVDNYSLNPNFNKETKNYNLTVKYDVSSVNVKAECNGKNCKVEGTGNKSLEVGVNPFKIVVTAENGDEEIYHLNVTREKDTRSSDTALKSLSVDNYSLNPNFNKETKNYNLIVKYDVSSINVKAACNGKNCKVEGTGKKTLETGINTIKVIVTAENGDKETYYLNVTREKDIRSSDATLKDVKIIDSTTNTTIDHSFKIDEYDYEINIPYYIKNVNFDILCNDNKCKYNEIKNQKIEVGKNKISINVVAENGNKKTYTYNIIRNEETKQKLSFLKVNGYSLLPSFSGNNYEYKLTINEDVNTLNIEYEKEYSYSKVEIIGNENISVNNINQIKIIVSGDNSNNDTTYILNLDKTNSSIDDDKETNNNMGLVILCGVLGLALIATMSIVIYNKKNKN